MTVADPRAAVVAKRSCLQAHNGVPRGSTRQGRGGYLLSYRAGNSCTMWGHNPCTGLTDLVKTRKNPKLTGWGITRYWIHGVRDGTY